MGEAFRLGGWGMYPTLFVGIVLVLAAGRFALAPHRGRARLAPIVGLGVLVALTSTLGFVTGIIKTTLAAAQMNDLNERGGTIVQGFGESLNNIGFGLCLLVLATLGVCIGLARGKSATSAGVSELVDPLR